MSTLLLLQVAVMAGVLGAVGGGAAMAAIRRRDVEFWRQHCLHALATLANVRKINAMPRPYDQER